uniref:Uncharacterized protein n=1 Tax=Tanacetum cinerariifolium TaxID=118510 RepID=A0A699GU12_TANCI|nr:hypothetical protein [Tanacetum cinerariifolium]
MKKLDESGCPHSLQQQVLDLEEAKITQPKDIAKLKKRVKKLKKRRKSRPVGLRRLKEIALVDEAQRRMHDIDMFRVDDLEVTAATVEDSVAPTTPTTTDVDDELTLEKNLIEIKATKPKVISTTITTPRAKGIVFYEQVQAHIPTFFSSKDKGKAKMIELEKPLKKKDQIALDEEVARKLEAEMRAEMKEEERITMEKDEANRAVIKE